MKSFFSKLSILVYAVLILGMASSVYAQATRTWVSGVGDDANPCSRTAPCKTFAGAISKTAAGGEIDVLDDGGFGAVTITKSITINGGGHVAGILVAATDGVIINAAVTDVVILRGLTFTGFLGAPNAVRYQSAKYIVVEDSTIGGFLNGINMFPSAINGRMDIRNVQITNATGTPNTYGVYVGSIGSITTIVNTNVRGVTTGIVTRGGETYVRGSTLVNNDTAFSNQGGNLYSFGDNMVVGGAGSGGISAGGGHSTPTGMITHF